MATNAKKVATVEHLQVTTEWEEKHLEEISRMKVDLESARVELESAQQSITSQEVRIKKKKHAINKV